MPWLSVIVTPVQLSRRSVHPEGSPSPDNLGAEVGEASLSSLVAFRWSPCPVPYLERMGCNKLAPVGKRLKRRQGPGLQSISSAKLSTDGQVSLRWEDG